VPDPDAAFVMLMRSGKPERAILFLPPKDPRIALYTGFLPSAEEVRQKYGMELRTMDGLRVLVDSLTAQRATVWNLPDVATRDVLGQDSLTRGTTFLVKLRAGIALLTINSAQAALDSLRVRKSSAEVAMLRRAVQITMQGRSGDSCRGTESERSRGASRSRARFPHIGRRGGLRLDRWLRPEFDELPLPREQSNDAGRRGRGDGHGRAYRATPPM
jgi:hypothetical protein